MKPYIFITLFLVVIFSCHGQERDANNPSQTHERVIKNYFDGWVKKDWNLAERQLADGFTFTSPAPDDHIPIEKFKEKCWPQATFIQRFEFVKILENNNEAFAIIHVVTIDNRIIRNTEYFTFSDGKIKQSRFSLAGVVRVSRPPPGHRNFWYNAKLSQL